MRGATQVIEPLILTSETISDEELTAPWDANAAVRDKELADYDDPAYRALGNLIGRRLSFLFPSPDGKKLGDLGCGTGHESRAFAAMGFDVKAVDPSSESIRLARQTASNGALTLDFEVGTVESLAERSAMTSTFDVLVANMVIHCTPRLGAFANACGELLTDDGVLVVTLPDPLNYLQSRPDLDVRQIDLTRDQAMRIPFRIHGREPHPSSVYYFHRPFNSILAAFRGAGLVLSDLDMPAQVGIGKPRDIVLLTFVKAERHRR